MKNQKYSSIIIDDSNKIPKKDITDWNNIANSVLTKYQFIKIFEDEKIIKIKPKHILVYDNLGKLVGFAILYIENEAIYSTFEESCYGKYTKYLNKFISLKPTLACYIPAGFAIKAIEAQNDNEKIFEKIIDTMSYIAKSEKIKQYAIYYVPDDSDALTKVLQGKKFNKIFSTFTSYIDIKWESFDDYVKSLKEPKNIRREIKKNAEMNVKIEEISYKDSVLSDVSSVINDNLIKYSEKAREIPSNFLKKITREFPDEIKMYKVTLDKHFIGGMLCVKGKNFLHNGKGGQKNINIKNYSFFESAVYTPVRIAIKEKIPRVYLGTHAYSYKKKRGAKTLPLYIYVKSDNAFRNFILKYIFSFLNSYKYKKHNKLLNKSDN